MKAELAMRPAGQWWHPCTLTSIIVTLSQGLSQPFQRLWMALSPPECVVNVVLTGLEDKPKKKKRKKVSLRGMSYVSLSLWEYSKGIKEIGNEFILGEN